MVTEAVISTFLEASITGAGLVLAIYALMTPISRKIFQECAKKLNDLIEEFDAEKVKITADSTKKDYNKLKNLSSEIKQYRNFPKYLGIGIIVSFLFFMMEAIIDCVELIVPPPGSNMITGIFFIIGVSSFLLVGFFAIFEILSMMLKEFDAVNKRRKEAEETAKVIINGKRM